MFSFFRSSKKPSPVESPEHSEAASEADEFVVIGGGGADPATGLRQPIRPPPRPPVTYGAAGAGAGVYPSLGPAGPSSAASPYPAPVATVAEQLQRQDSQFSYLQGVPFRLSPELRVEGVNRADTLSIEVDQILANMTRALELYGGGE